MTIISKSFHDTYLPQKHSGGQDLPYLGYIEVNILFPESVAGKSEHVSTLALIIPDCRSNTEVLVLIGTNVPLVQNMCSRHNIKQENGKVGRIKLQCKKAILITASVKMVLNGNKKGAHKYWNPSLSGASNPIKSTQ